MKKLFLALLLLSAAQMFAQADTSKIAGLSASSTDCSTANSCLMVGTQNYGVATVSVIGTFTGSTITFEFTDDPNQGTWFQNTCTRSDLNLQEGSEALTNSTARAWDCGVAAAQFFRVRQSAIGTGTVTVRITLSLAQIEPAATVSVGFQSAPAQSLSGSAQTPITVSATGAASAANSSLPGVAGKTTYITGFQVTGAGATAASVIAVTVTGTITGTMNYRIVIPAGVTTSITPLIVSFPVPVPASAVNTAIVVNVPSFGAGNTDSASAAQGFQQ